MSQYTVEQIEASILAYKAGDLNYCRAGIIDLLTAYAATLRQNPERRVSSEEVRLSLDYSRNFARANPRLSKTTVEHIEGLCNLVERLAALSAEPAAQGDCQHEAWEETGSWCKCVDCGHGWSKAAPPAPEPAAQGEAVATVKSWTNGSYHRNYVIEWHRNVNAGTKLYTAPPAQPAERVPDGWKLVPIDATPAMQAAGGHANSEWLNDNAPIGESRYGGPVMRSVWEAMLAASPAPSEGGKGVEDRPKYVPQKPCQCFNTRQRELCADKFNCSVVSAQQAAR